VSDPTVSVEAVMADLQGRVRERRRRRLQARIVRTTGASGLEDAAVFDEVEALLQKAADTGDAEALLLPELLGDPATWRLETALRYQSHRSRAPASIIVFLKRRVLLPLLRWLFEYSRDNFERQRRVNRVLFACVQELAAETVRLREEVHRLTSR
jgi:hypothetical protein